MKKIVLFALLALVSCTNTDPIEINNSIEETSNEINETSFQSLLDAAGVKGSILISVNDNFHSNNFEWAKAGHLPASTFKIPNSMIALELGIMENDSTISYWDGEPRFMKSWEQDLVFRDAFHYSCVPCYQEIARKVGVERMRQFTRDFKYGNMVIDSTNIDQFWLGGDSQISQFEQIDFLKRFVAGDLPISDRTQELMSQMMIIEENEDYILRGKTGWSVQNEVDNCWFVGCLESKNEFYYFATNIEPKTELDVSQLVSIRKTVTRKALQSLKLL